MRRAQAPCRGDSRREAPWPAPQAPIPPARQRGRRTRAFTFVESLITLVIAALLLVGVTTFFGDALQRFTHQEDTLSGAHEAQLLLETLRRDVRHLDGREDAPPLVSSESETGTTWPKFWVHACHVPGAPKLEVFARRLERPGDPIPAQHPAGAALTGPGAEAAAARAQLTRIENAYTRVVPDWDDETQPQYLVLNVREGTQLARVVYSYTPGQKGVTRHGPDGQVKRFASPTLQSFLATPYVELVHDPGDPAFVPRVVKTWLEVAVTLQADEEVQPGAKIAGRAITLRTRLLPFYLNAALKSTWSP